MRISYERLAALASTKELMAFLGLAGVGVFLPFVLHLQWLTGPIVNAVLILVLFLVGVRAALLMCLIPSLMALTGGLLPAVLAPAVPFIMTGNALFILTIDRFYELSKDPVRGYALGVIAGAGLKFIFLFLSVGFISRLLFKEELAAGVAQMMSWPQLGTALAGGAIAWIVLKWLKRL